MGTVYGYARVSTDGQDLEPQLQALRKAGCTALIEERASGAGRSRPELACLLRRLHASWVHGNALTVETPGNLDRVGHFGWGADMAIRPGKDSWFHIPLPTPVITSDVRTKIQRLFLMFDAVSGSIRNVRLGRSFNPLAGEGLPTGERVSTKSSWTISARSGVPTAKRGRRA